MDGRSKPCVLVVGAAPRGDFATVCALLRTTARVWFVPDLETAAAWLDGSRGVDWIVLVQSRPGQLPRDMVERLRPLAGPARFVSVLGSWCEGELRTGQPWPGVPRYYWYAFPSWWRSVVTDDAEGNRGSLVAVSSVDFATAECLLDAFAIENLGGVWWPRHDSQFTARGVGVGIWMGGQLRGQDAFHLDAFCQRLRRERAPTIAVLDFPRRDELELARRIGVAEVLGQPWLLADVAQTVRRLQETTETVTDNRSLAIRSA